MDSAHEEKNEAVDFSLWTTWLRTEELREFMDSSEDFKQVADFLLRKLSEFWKCS